MFFEPFFAAVLKIVAAYRRTIIRLFYVAYLAFAIVIPVLIWSLINQPDSEVWVTFLGKSAGQMSVLLFLASTYPGILGRFRVRHSLITIGMSLRRHIGISAFLLGLAHAVLNYLVPALLTGTLWLAFTPYIAFGTLALLIFLLLTLTSNDVSTRLLGTKWKMLHQSVYIAYWLIFLHLIFQQAGVLGLVVGASAILEILSLLYDWQRKQNKV